MINNCSYNNTGGKRDDIKKFILDNSYKTIDIHT
jgi:hypothetical protein